MYLASKGGDAFGYRARPERRERLALEVVVSDFQAEIPIFLRQPNLDCLSLRVSADVTESFGHEMENLGR